MQSRNSSTKTSKNTLIRIWNTIRHGHDPAFPDLPDKLDRIDKIVNGSQCPTVVTANPNGQHARRISRPGH